MTVVVNGQQREVPPESTLTDVVAQLTAAPQGIAVALNGSVVPRGSWPNTVLTDADTVEVLTAVQGG
ncbi:MAG: sulfur carrier protein [Actinomycetota bacterium]|jgi:sulfur carrier protein|nr:sulfur carrier protein [Actinomycetota bacterium]MDQ1494225.1 sulfur carrier protein [Actinomycetota bacterium]MDQ1539929.1 sulfur carrier protein [Actinomycetota bacterium]